MLAAQDKYGKRPMLTDEEMEAQYKYVYTKAARHSSAEVNLVCTLFSTYDVPFRFRPKELHIL
jgi:hypothetical protein